MLCLECISLPQGATFPLFRFAMASLISMNLDFFESSSILSCALRMIFCSCFTLERARLSHMSVNRSVLLAQTDSNLYFPAYPIKHRASLPPLQLHGTSSP